MGTRLGFDRNLEAAFSYLFGWITGLLFYLVEDDRYVRFHAAQSILLFGSVYLVTLAIGEVLLPVATRLSPLLVPVLLPVATRLSPLLVPVLNVVAPLISLASFGLWLLLIYKAYTGERYRLPVVGDLADRYA